MADFVTYGAFTVQTWYHGPITNDTPLVSSTVATNSTYGWDLSVESDGRLAYGKTTPSQRGELAEAVIRRRWGGARSGAWASPS